MNSGVCDREQHITAAATRGHLSPEMLQHIETCPACSEAALIGEFFSEAVDDLPRAPLPAAGLIWWRAQLGKKRELAERSVAPIALIRNISICIGIVLAIVCAVKVLPSDPGLLMITASAFFSLVLSVGGVLYAWVSERI